MEQMTQTNKPTEQMYKLLQKGGILALGGMLAIFAVATMENFMQASLLMAPFGATCVIAFVLPESPLARPRNIIGGHFISALIGIIMLKLVGVHPWSLALAVGLAIFFMVLTDTIHPPAGANPIITMLTGASWSFLLSPVTLGALLIFGLALAYHACRGIKYPSKWF